MFAKTRDTLFVTLTILWWIYIFIMLLVMAAIAIGVSPMTIASLYESLWESLRQDVLETFSRTRDAQNMFGILMAMLFGGCVGYIGNIFFKR